MYAFRKNGACCENRLFIYLLFFLLVLGIEIPIFYAQYFGDNGRQW